MESIPHSLKTPTIKAFNSLVSQMTYNIGSVYREVNKII